MFIKENTPDKYFNLSVLQTEKESQYFDAVLTVTHSEGLQHNVIQSILPFHFWGWMFHKLPLVF